MAIRTAAQDYLRKTFVLGGIPHNDADNAIALNPQMTLDGTTVKTATAELDVLMRSVGYPALGPAEAQVWLDRANTDAPAPHGASADGAKATSKAKADKKK